MTATQADIVADLQRTIAALRGERDAALAREAALAEVLAVINRSPGNLAPVFDAILEQGIAVCDAAFGTLSTFDGQLLHLASTRGLTPEMADSIRKPRPPAPGQPTGRIYQGEEFVHLLDATDQEGYRAGFGRTRAFVDKVGARTALFVALRSDTTLLGYLVIFRREVRAFSDTQIALVRSFAHQAVIAMENARLLGELQARTTELAVRNSEFGERIAQQSAIIDVLKVMSASPGDLRPVFELIGQRARELCGSPASMLFEFDGELLHLRSWGGWEPAAAADYLKQFPMRPDRGTANGRAILERRIIHIRDVPDDPELSPTVRMMGVGSTIAVPLLRDAQPLGTIAIGLPTRGGFSDSQIALLQTFAEQAVIAIGSVATFKELQQRTAELVRSVGELQALEEVMRAVNSSLDLQTVLATIIDRAVLLAQADEGMIYEFDAAEQVFVPKAAFGMTEDRIARLRERRITIGETPLGISAASRAPLHIADLTQAPEAAGTQELVGAGIHALLAVPLLREDKVVGGLVIRRRAVGGFAPTTVPLMQTFAAQCVLAIENARLFETARRARAASDAALADLKRAQDRLVQSEKMASLGQLTAGIAHEIKNPLNFVNNFSALSAELIDELREALAPAPIDAGLRAEIDEATALLKSNLEKVVQHGKRADGIVKNMLLHSREGGGEMRSVDLNATVDEALNLAYHGARAEKPGFNITLVRNFDPAAGSLDLYPQEFTRVLLNLISNGFYAATRKLHDAAEPAFEPTLSVTTEARPDAIAIRIRDNGIGIPDNVRTKMFEPFFTTKPAGEGTGLGLSLSHDIVVKQHGGSISVESRVGEFTEFTVTLPRAGA